MYTIAPQLSVGSVTLNVGNLEKMKTFYKDILGMTIIREVAGEVHLGARDQRHPLVVLKILPDSADMPGRVTGLFHLALLLPSRRDLGEILIHLLEKKRYPLTGASDHGYSEALYLSDPEGNGIEIYRDKEHSAWDIQPDGSIKGITEHMDAAGVISAAREEFSGLPAGTVMGHVHLTVSNLDMSSRYYQEKLGFTLTYDEYRGAKFLAAGGYHHHVGMNIWSGRGIALRTEAYPGLREVSFMLPDKDALDSLRKHLQSQKEAYSDSPDGAAITVVDPAQIHLRFTIQD